LLSLKMHGGYVAELAASLRKGAVRLQQGQVIDSTTRNTLSQTHAEIDRAALLAELAAHRASFAPPPPRAATELRVSSDIEHAPLMAAIADLLSAERERVLRVLGSGTLDARLLPFVIRLLAHAALIEPVTTALSAHGQHAVGQLLDVLQDPSEPLVVRRRLPRILQSVGSASAARGLWESLRAPEHVLRVRSARALSVMTAEQPQLAFETREVFELVRSEVRVSANEAGLLSHVFALLSLVLDRDALRLAREALASTDARQRGTALEYLNNTLPEPVRSELAAAIAERSSHEPPVTQF
jgi:hypothetical protein